MSGGGEEHRVGRRGQQKRRWDDENRGSCERCGSLCTRGAKLCASCRRDDQNAQSLARQIETHVMWNQGLSYRSIASRLGSTPGSINVLVQTMRKAGWDMPKRGPRGRALKPPESP